MDSPPFSYSSATHSRQFAGLFCHFVMQENAHACLYCTVIEILKNLEYIDVDSPKLIIFDHWTDHF